MCLKSLSDSGYTHPPSVGAWLSLVERLLRVQEVAGSNPVAPTIFFLFMDPTLLLIPTYNERENVTSLLQEIRNHVPEIDILFIDDNSPDGTGHLLVELQQQDPRLHILHRTEKAGLGAAYMAGFAWSLKREYAYSLCMDADFSHDPADIPRMMRELGDSDLAAGSRYMKGGRIQNWAFHRRFLSRGAAWYARLLTRMPFTDPTGGFNGYRNSMLATLPLQEVAAKGYSFQIEMKHLAWTSGFRTREFPIIFTERRAGRSKMSTGIIHEAIHLVIRLLSNKKR